MWHVTYPRRRRRPTASRGERDEPRDESRQHGYDVEVER